MAETDPFGRPKSEDPLAEMGWSDQPAPVSDPVIAEASSSPEIAPPQAPDRTGPPAPPSRYRPMGGASVPGGLSGAGRTAGRLGCLFALVVLGLLGGIGALVVPAVMDAIDEVEEAVEDATPTIPERERGGRAERRQGRERAARPPRGLQAASMLRRGNLAPAIRRLQRITKSSRVRLIRIDAQNVIVQTALSGGRTRLAQATWKGEASVLSTSPGGGGGSTFSWSQVDLSAPNRIVRAATRGRSSSTFDYLVMIDAAGLRWSAFLKDNRGSFQAQPDGSGVRKIG